MKPMSLTSPESIAREYKGNKKAIANAARMGLVDPTAALMAGMFIDRMRSAASEEQKADTTVAQDVFNAPMQQQGLPQAPMQAQPQPQQLPPQMAQAQGIPGAQMAAAQPQMAPGVEGLPTGNVGNYADGGIVAFASGNVVEGDELENYMGQMYPSTIEDTPEMRLYREQATRELLSQYGIEGPVPFYLTEEDKRKNEKLFNQGEQFKRAAERRETGRRGAEAAGKEFGLAGIMKGTDLNTSFSRLPRAGETTPAMSDVLDRRQAVQDTFRLPGIMKGKTDLSTGFKQEGAAVPADRRSAAEQLPPITTPKMGQGMPSDEEIADRTFKAVERIYPSKDMPKELTGREAMQSIKKAYAEAGYDSELFKKQQEEIAKERGELKAKRSEATNLRIIEAGMLIMGGKSPYGLQNISEATPAVKGLAQDIKDFDKADKEYRAAERTIAAEQNKIAAGMAGVSLDLVEKSKDRLDRASEKRGAASATIFSTIVGAEKQLEGISRQIEGQLKATGMNNESAANVARIYTGGYMALEQARQRGMPDVYKLANSPDMINSMPNSSFKERLEAVSQATHPKDIKNALLNATGQVQKRADEEWANKLLFDREIIALKKKADAGDLGAKQEFERRKQNTFDSKVQEYFAGYESLRQGAGGGEGDKLPGRAAPPGVGGFVVNTPQGPVSFTTKEQADAFRMKYNLP